MSDLTVRPGRPEELRRAGDVSVAAYLASGWLEPGDPYREHLADAAGRAAGRAAQRIYRRLGFDRLPDRDWCPDGRTVLLAYGLDL